MEPGLPAPRQHIASKVFADSTPACKNLFFFAASQALLPSRMSGAGECGI